jgi:hypothetical protein
MVLCLFAVILWKLLRFFDSATMVLAAILVAWAALAGTLWLRVFCWWRSRLAPLFRVKRAQRGSESDSGATGKGRLIDRWQVRGIEHFIALVREPSREFWADAGDHLFIV